MKLQHSTFSSSCLASPTTPVLMKRRAFLSRRSLFRGVLILRLWSSRSRVPR